MPFRTAIWSVALAVAGAGAVRVKPPHPHIVYLVVDDWGWANFAAHRAADSAGNEEFLTPNLAALAKNGTLLDRMYGHKFCGPSRAAIQTGRLPIHVTVLDNALPQVNPKDPISGFQGIPRNMTGVAQKLKGAGYATHMVGKWHCGLATHEHTPHGRGYDTSLNYFDAANDYWKQQYSSCLDKAGNPTLTDLWDTTQPAYGKNNSWRCGQDNQGVANCTWEDDMLQARLLSTIAAHDPSQPLMLFWSAHTVHEPYEVPTADLNKFSSIDLAVRQYYAAMIGHLDSLVPAVVDALKAKGMWDDLLWITTSDNGKCGAGGLGALHESLWRGPLAKDCSDPSNLLNTGGASNFPLRGGKIGIMEGGIRLNAFASGGLIPPAQRGTTYEGWLHLADFYATACALAGVDPTDHRAAAAGLPPIDSLDFSAVLLGTNMTSPRTEIAIGSSDDSDHTGNTIVAGLIDADGWKLIIPGNVDPAFYQGPVFPNRTTTQQPHLTCHHAGCLFNVLTDPTEESDVAETNPAKVKELTARIAELQRGVFNPDRGTNDREMCLTGLSKWGGFLGPWL